MKYLQYLWLIPYNIWAWWWFIFFALLAIPVYALILLLSGGKNITALYKYNRFWGLGWGLLCGVRYRIYHRENLERLDACVIAANHISMADMFIVASAMRVAYRVLGKIELKKIPVMSWFFTKCLVYVDRSDPESRRRSVEELKKVVAQGVSILIFPEGTRNRTGQPLKNFYDGAFRIAIECELPIVPMVLMNVAAIYSEDEKILRPGTITCRFLPPVSTRGMTLNDVERLKQQVYAMMEQEILDHC